MYLSCFVFYVEYLSGVIHAPSILEDCEGVMRSIFCGPSGVLRKMSTSFSANFHLPDTSPLKLSRYHLVLLDLTFPSVARSAPANISSPEWDIFIVSSIGVVGEGGI